MSIDYAFRLWSQIEILIEEEIARLQSSPSLVLEIEATIRDVQDAHASELSERRHLITVDLNRWCRETNRTVRDRGSYENLPTEANRVRNTPLPIAVGANAPNTDHTNDTSVHSRPSEAHVNSKALTGASVQPRQRAKTVASSTDCQHSKRRKLIEGEQPRGPSDSDGALTSPHTPPSTRQLCSDANVVPQRKKPGQDGVHGFRPSTLDKLIIGIWEQLHGGVQFTPPSTIPELAEARSCRETSIELKNGSADSFRKICDLCQRVSGTARSFRALEIIIQAHWVECFDARVAVLGETNEGMIGTSNKKLALMEACRDLSWTEKELRNRMAIWRGYLEMKDAAGWAALVFSGAGLYRYCKYRVGFDTASISKLARLRSRFEVAADTLHPRWRDLLAVIGQQCRRVYYGHPHDWTVSNNSDPVPLAWTYRQVDPIFTYTHIETSVVDQDVWGTSDPRRLELSEQYTCVVCRKLQSQDANENLCECFPDLAIRHMLYPVQVFRTDDGRNNGLLACCPFDRGTIVGEFVGLVTKGMENVDVFTGQAGSNLPYQIFQGRLGNHTRFINHSCLPNCQFQSFSWLGIERILLVSKGIPAGREITVDYSYRYWRGLDKECRCGQKCCQYKHAASRLR